MEYLLSTNNLTKRYKNQIAVDNISLHLKRGSIYGLIGENGAGKTTFLKMISGLSGPTSGDISLFGYSGQKRRRVLSRISILVSVGILQIVDTIMGAVIHNKVPGRFSILYYTTSGNIGALAMNSTSGDYIRAFIIAAAFMIFAVVISMHITKIRDVK